MGILRKQEELIISIGEARKLLGKEAQEYSDEKVEKLIREMMFLCNILIKDNLVNKLNE